MAHAVNKLTALDVSKLKEPSRYGNGARLYLMTDPGGSRRWQMIFRHGGKQREMGLGSASLFSLANARRKMVDRRSWLRGGALWIAALCTFLPALPAMPQGMNLPDGAEAAATLPPSNVMAKAQALLGAGRGDEAAFWFYAGQLRYRSYLAAHRDLDQTGHPALFAALIETIGRPVNDYAFGDVTKLASTISMVLEWDRRYPDPSLAGPEHEQTRNGLEGLRVQIMAQADSIRRERQQRGLPNR